MRTVAAFEHMTLDGYASSGQGTGFEWTFHAFSDEFAEFADGHLRADIDTAIYGRQTYLGMYGYWGDQPTAESSAHERAHAEWVKAVDKIVCSTTLESADWNNTRLIRGDLAREFAELKAGPGGTMAIYASPRLVHSFVDLGLIDEFRLIVHPVVLGSGTPLFHDKSALDLDLMESQAFESGAIYLRYRVGRERIA
ncbi:dihydrofolate reductase family protein [Nocardia sp. NPDC051570]|uniref:dihydrofolate reductase family protein n=1 Tax=Nocardia sp. NPDC051570 TaxID=3364324 RepID=UPI00379914A0